MRDSHEVLSARKTKPHEGSALLAKILELLLTTLVGWCCLRILSVEVQSQLNQGRFLINAVNIRRLRQVLALQKFRDVLWLGLEAQSCQYDGQFLL